MTSTTATEDLTGRLDRLKALGDDLRWQSLLDSAQKQRAQRQRLFLLATAGAIVATIAALLMAFAHDPLGYTALPLTAIVMAIIATRSAHQLRDTCADTPDSLLAVWQEEIDRRRRHALYSVPITAAAAGLTAWVLTRHGLTDPRSWAYVTLCAVLCWYSCYQVFVVRPRLAKETQWLFGTAVGRND